MLLSLPRDPHRVWWWQASSTWENSAVLQNLVCLYSDAVFQKVNVHTHTVDTGNFLFPPPSVPGTTKHLMNYELSVKVPLQTLGQLGRVMAVVNNDGVVLVRIKDRVWAYSPLCLTPTPELATSIPTGINYSAVN